MVKKALFVSLSFSLAFLLPTPTIEASERFVSEMDVQSSEIEYIDETNINDNAVISQSDSNQIESLQYEKIDDEAEGPKGDSSVFLIDEANDETIEFDSLSDEETSLVFTEEIELGEIDSNTIESADEILTEEIADTANIGEETEVEIELDENTSETLDKRSENNPTIDEQTFSEVLTEDRENPKVTLQTMGESSTLATDSEEDVNSSEPFVEEVLVEETTSSKPKRSSILGISLGGKLLKPLLGNVSISLFGIGVDKNSERSGLLDIEISESPLLGSLKVSLLGGKKKTIEKENDKSDRRIGGSLLSLELDNFLTKNTKIDLLSNEKSGNGDTEVQQSGLLSVNVETPLTGRLNTSLLSGGKIKSENGEIRNGKLLTLGLDNALLGEVNTSVASGEQSIAETSSFKSGSLVSLRVNNRLLGEVEASVAEGSTKVSETEVVRSGGLLSVGVNNPILGGVDVGVLKKDDSGSSLVNIGTKDLPLLGDIAVGIGVNENRSPEKDSDSSEQEKDLESEADVNDPSKPTKPDRGDGDKTKTDNDKENEKTPDKKPGKPVEKDQNPDIVEDDSRDNSNIGSLPQTPIEDFQKGDAYEDNSNKSVIDNDKFGDELFEAFLNESLSDKDKSVYNVAKDLLNTGKNLVFETSQELEWKQSELDLSKKNANDFNSLNGSKAIVVSSPSSSNVNSGSYSSSGGGSSSSTNYSDVLAGYLQHRGSPESRLSSLATSTVKKLQTKWIKEPPDKPPKYSFI